MVSTCVVLIRLLFRIVVSVLVSFHFTAHALMVQSRAELVVGLVIGLSRCGSGAAHLQTTSEDVRRDSACTACTRSTFDRRLHVVFIKQQHENKTIETGTQLGASQGSD